MIISCNLLFLGKGFLAEVTLPQAGITVAAGALGSQQVVLKVLMLMLINTHTGSASLTERLQEFDEIMHVSVPYKPWSTTWMVADSVLNSRGLCDPCLLEASPLGQSLMTWLKKATGHVGSPRQSLSWVNQKGSLAKGSKDNLASGKSTFSEFLRQHPAVNLLTLP